jgi:hypothetical protein
MYNDKVRNFELLVNNLWAIVKNIRKIATTWPINVANIEQEILHPKNDDKLYMNWLLLPYSALEPRFIAGLVSVSLNLIPDHLVHLNESEFLHRSGGVILSPAERLEMAKLDFKLFLDDFAAEKFILDDEIEFTGGMWTYLKIWAMRFVGAEHFLEQVFALKVMQPDDALRNNDLPSEAVRAININFAAETLLDAAGADIISKEMAIALIESGRDPYRTRQEVSNHTYVMANVARGWGNDLGRYEGSSDSKILALPMVRTLLIELFDESYYQENQQTLLRLIHDCLVAFALPVPHWETFGGLSDETRTRAMLLVEELGYDTDSHRWGFGGAEVTLFKLMAGDPMAITRLKACRKSADYHCELYNILTIYNEVARLVGHEA